MLLGCCHCPGDQPSVPPSDASGSASSVPISQLSFSTFSVDEGCFCDAVPKRWQVTTPVFFTPGPAGCTNFWDLYSGTFVLYHDAAASSGCTIWYQSAERMLSYNGCVETSSVARFTLRILLSGASAIYTFQMNFTTDITSVAVTWGETPNTCLDPVVFSGSSPPGYPDLTVSPA